MGDTEELAKKSGATIVTEMDMANDYAQKGFKVEGPNYGGTVHFDWGDVKMDICQLVWLTKNTSYENVGGIFLRKNTIDS